MQKKSSRYGLSLFSYRADGKHRSSTFAVQPFWMNNDALDPMDQFERSVAAVLQWLRGLAPAAIENGVGGRHACGGSCLLASHDADQNADGSPGMAAGERANFNKSLGHARFLASPVQQAGLRQHRRER